MNFSKITLFQLLQGKMAYLSERQGLISHNIANANTPHFKPKDLKKPDFNYLLQGKNAGGIDMKITNPRHIEGYSSGGGFGGRATKSFETIPVGNSVVVEEEAMKMAETSADFQTATSVYRRVTDMFRTAITPR